MADGRSIRERQGTASPPEILCDTRRTAEKGIFVEADDGPDNPPLSLSVAAGQCPRRREGDAQIPIFIVSGMKMRALQNSSLRSLGEIYGAAWRWSSSSRSLSPRPPPAASLPPPATVCQCAALWMESRVEETTAALTAELFPFSLPPLALDPQEHDRAPAPAVERNHLGHRSRCKSEAGKPE